MADAFEVSLDYLVVASEKQINKEMLNRIEEVDKLKPEDKKMVFTFLDAFIIKTKETVNSTLFYTLKIISTK